MSRAWTNASIVEAIVNGDPNLLRAFYAAMTDSAFPIFSSWGIPSSEHDDVLHEGMMSLFINVKTGKYKDDKNTKIESYLLQICKYSWYGQRRKKVDSNTNYMDQSDLSRLQHKMEDDLHTLSSDGDSDERIGRLMKGIASMGDRCQELLRLFYWEGLPLDIIATRMDMTKDSAKNAKYRCMMKLKGRLNP